MKSLTHLFAYLLTALPLLALNVELKSSLETTASDILVKDLIKSTNGVDEALQNLKIFDAPTKGEPQYFTVYDVAYAMNRHNALHHLRLVGRGVTISYTGVSPKVLKITQLTRQAMANRAPWKSWDIQVTFSLADEIQLRATPEFDHLKISILDAKSMLGQVPLRLRFFDQEGTEVARTDIKPDIQREVKVLTAKDSLKMGHILQAEDLEYITINVGDDRQNYLSDKAACIGRELNRGLKAGELITDRYLLEPTCVERGDWLRVACNVGALNVTVRVMALEQGRLADFIKVENPKTRKRFMVKLTGNKEGIYTML